MSRIVDPNLHLGEVNKASNNMLMTVVAYRGRNDIDVQFEDGTVAYNKNYGCFLKGTIRYPDSVIPNYLRLGETKLMNCGLYATIIEYNSATDITIKFENGIIKKKVSYSKFKVGQVSSTLNKSSIRIGEINKANNGLVMKIIDYRSATDIDIQFEDGTIRRGVSYRSFKLGEISLNQRAELTLGIWRVSNSGLKFRIIEKLPKNKCIIEFEDGVKKEVTRSNIHKGAVAHPSQARAKRDVKTRIGETSYHTSGELMTLIEWKNSEDITIKFEDGTIVTNKSYGSFKSGEISKYTKPFKDRILGKKNKAKNGLEMTIIAVRDGKDIDIQFEDGIIVTNKRYKAFKDGEIKHPDYTIKKDRVGEIHKNSQGVELVIIDYKNNKDIDIKFEDGFILNSVNYNTILNGFVGHPAFRNKGGIFGNFIYNGLAYKLNDNNCFYYCECSKCGKKDILSPKQMLEHKC